MRIKYTIIIWLVVIIAIIGLIPQTRNLMLSNLLIRSKEVKREPADTSKTPYNAVGRLIIPGGVCTATLVDSHLIITASHCVIKDKEFVRPENITFQLERNGQFEDKAIGKYMLASQEFLDFGFPAIAKDYAFIYLDNPVPIESEYPRVAQKSPEIQAKIIQAGYGPDKHDKLFADDGCTLQELENTKYGKLARTNCLIVPGDSGGPIFEMRKNVWFLVGINTALMGNKQIMEAFAIPAENYVKEFWVFKEKMQNAPD